MKKTIDGFTLIELVMTIVVIGIIVIPLALVIRQHVESALQSSDYTLMANLGRYRMEELNNTAYGNILPGTFFVPNYRGYNNYDLTTTITYDQGTAGSAESLKKALIDVKKSNNPAIKMSLITYFAKNLTYGL